MQDERETSRDETEDSGQQQPIGQDSTKSEFGGSGGQQQPAASGSEQPRSSDRQGLSQDQSGQAGGTEGEGFIGRKTSGQQDFAPEGQGALEGEDEDVEGGEPRSERTDIERE